MRYVRNALVVALVVLTMSLAVLAQTPRRTDDPRNIAPTVGSGGSVGGATGLFTVVDGQTLRRGEYTFSAAYSNYDRDPGNVDITEVPLSFQIGLNDYIEVFFNTDAYRGIKVNSPTNLSGFYLPNSRINGISPAALVLTPAAFAGGNIANRAVFRPAGQQPFVQFPYVGGAGGGIFGTLGPARAGSGNGADLFPGIGSVVGGILPGLVLRTTGTGAGTVINTSTLAPAYLPDAPFLNRTWGESAFNTFTVGGKFRFTKPKSRIGLGLLPFYRFYADKPDDASGFNQLQRGASPGSKRGDFGLIAFGDARLAKWANVSANIGYTYNSSVKANFGSNNFTLLDRGDELNGGLAVDFPVNKYFQPIGEIRATKYVGGRTPNAFEQDPIDALLGVRVFPTRYFGMSFAYRYNVNQQDSNSFDGSGNTSTGTAGSINGVPAGFVTSDDPHGFLVQVFAGRRNKREVPTKPNTPAVINSVTLSKTEIVLPTCPEGQRIKAGSTACNDNSSVTVATNATDADGDQLLYQYTVSGGRINGSGANVNWDLSGAQPGTYTISVGVDDGCGVCGTPSTKEVRIVNCTDCEVIPPPCPTDLRVTASPSDLVKPGDTVTFTADATLNGASPNYTWTVSAGDIVSGQGTSSITVTAPAGAATSFTATATLNGLDPACTNNTASATVETQSAAPIARLLDEYNKLKPDQEKARLDAVATQLNADPNAKLYVIGYGSEKGGAAEAKRLIDFAVKYLTGTKRPALGIDTSRVVTINGGGSATGPRTQIYLVPAGATEPVPNP